MGRGGTCPVLYALRWWVVALLIFSCHPTVALSLGCLPSSKQLPPRSLQLLCGNTSWVSCHHPLPYLSNLLRDEPFPPPPAHLGTYNPALWGWICTVLRIAPFRKSPFLVSFPFPGFPGPALLLASQPQAAPVQGQVQPGPSACPG